MKFLGVVFIAYLGFVLAFGTIVAATAAATVFATSPLWVAILATTGGVMLLLWVIGKVGEWRGPSLDYFYFPGLLILGLFAFVVMIWVARSAAAA